MIVTQNMAAEAAELLGLTAPFNEADISRAYREQAKLAHPDAGGTAEKFAAVDRAKHILMRWLEKPEAAATPTQKQNDCPRCHGKGFVISQRAFRQMRVMCITCRGTGDADYDHDKTDTGVNR